MGTACVAATAIKLQPQAEKTFQRLRPATSTRRLESRTDFKRPKGFTPHSHDSPQLCKLPFLATAAGPHQAISKHLHSPADWSKGLQTLLGIYFLHHNLKAVRFGALQPVLSAGSLEIYYLPFKLLYLPPSPSCSSSVIVSSVSRSQPLGLVARVFLRFGSSSGLLASHSVSRPLLTLLDKILWFPCRQKKGVI
jgi:hypothetical protein